MIVSFNDILQESAESKTALCITTEHGDQSAYCCNWKIRLAKEEKSVSEYLTHPPLHIKYEASLNDNSAVPYRSTSQALSHYLEGWV